MVISDDLLDRWSRDAAAPFQGWDFSYLKGRFSESRPPWDYLALAAHAVAKASDILDVATGGGEVFASLAPFPVRATAVEGYAPNVPLARRRLEPLGARVFQADTSSRMPFDDAAFDLVLNRHGGFRAEEVHRVLKSGGVFLTQQVGGENLADLSAVFGAEPTYPENTLDRVRGDLLALGFEVRRAEKWDGPVTFSDVGAVIYFLKAIPWVVPGFEVGRHVGPLAALQHLLDAGQQLRFTYTRFLIEAMRR